MQPTQTTANILKRWQWTRVHQFLHDNHGIRYFVMALTIIVATGIALLAWLYQQPQEQPATYAVVTPTPPEKPKFYSPLTGVEVVDEAATKRQVTAVMIENSPDSRPQSGLKDAGIVYEAVAEGGITRFIALYQESRPGLVGPVRSVRPYYVEWASAYDPGVAHVGGSARALQMIRSGGYGVDLDQFFNAGTYWRANDRYAPHNVYTNFDNLDALNTAKGKTTSTFIAQSRQDEKKAETPNATSIDIGVSSGSYAVHYDYDAASNSYIRKQGNEPHTDREGGQIQPKVAVAIKVAMSLGFEDGNREQITTTGTGEAFIFQNGTVTTAIWKRDTDRSPLQLLDSNGAEIALNRGQTWITALASTRNVSWQ